MLTLKRLDINVHYLLLCVFVLVVSTTKAGTPRNFLFEKVIEYGQYYKKQLPDSISMNAYSKCFIQVKKRNVTLWGMPTMLYLMRDGRRKALVENYEHDVFYSNGTKKVVRKVWLSTAYHRHAILLNLLDYMRPHLYDAQLFPNGMLSPINKANKKYYYYKTEELNDTLSKISFKGRRINTELVRHGYILVETKTGRITNFYIEGELDMVHFMLSGIMGIDGFKSIMPRTCSMYSSIKFIGNNIQAQLMGNYDMPISLPDSIVDSHDAILMEKLRPLPLGSMEQETLEEYFPEIKKSELVFDSAKIDTISIKPIKKKRSWVKTILWNTLGETLLKHITAQTADDKGSMRIAPILNPLYFGYSHRKGIYYKVDIRGYYNFTSNSNLEGRLKLGYSFKERQVFYRLPITYNFSKDHYGYVRVEFSNGNRITNSRVLESIKNNVHRDTVNWDQMHLDYFKDTRLDLSAAYDVLYNRLSLQLGTIFHRRAAVNKTGFLAAKRTDTYTSFAPYIGVSWYPFTRDVPFVFTAQYEHGIKTLGGNMIYSRIESDLQYVKYLTSMKSWSVRIGAGGYLNKKGETYFLDYKNFQENYIPNGWNDDWTGEFELLNSNWYNASNIYLRTNITYESPMMLLAWMPWLGRIVEKERIYISGLGVKQLWPYTEVGYGFTNRVFSAAIFTGFSQRHFEGFGIKFGFELFDNW